MFLRIKKSKLSGDRTKYAFMICENHREDGKVKQKVIKYLSSHTDEYADDSLWQSSTESVREEHKARKRMWNDWGRIFFWLDIRHDLQDVDGLDPEKIPEMVERIDKVVQFPTEAVLQSWIQGQWSTSAIMGHKDKDETQKYIDRVKQRYEEMCSAYGCSAALQR